MCGYQQTITLVDGTLISALTNIMEASWRKATTGKGMVRWRLHTHSEVLKGVPSRIDVTSNGGGEYDERAASGTTLEADRLYVPDRRYAKFEIFNKIVAVNSSYVCRLREALSNNCLKASFFDRINKMYGIIRFESCSTVEKLVLFQTVWQAATY